MTFWEVGQHNEILGIGADFLLSFARQNNLYKSTQIGRNWLDLQLDADVNWTLYSNFSLVLLALY